MSNDAGLPARKAALSLLSAVLRKRRPLDALLDTLKNLPSRDAGFARALASGALRHFGFTSVVSHEEENPFGKAISVVAAKA